MSGRLIPLSLALATLVVASADARTLGSTRAATTITISSSVPAFHGKVRSGKPACATGRRVELLRKRPGKDPRSLGVDRTTGSGRWKIPVGNLKSGAYLAKVAPKGRANCAGARSETVLVD